MFFTLHFSYSAFFIGVLKQIGIEGNGSKKEKLRHCFLFSHHLIIASRTCDGHLRLSKVKCFPNTSSSVSFLLTLIF